MQSYVINLYGAPGVGKSTLAAELFAELKKRNISTEITLEFAKELVYNEDKRLLSDQLIVLAEQYRRIFVLNGKVDFIITDSPVLLSVFYNRLNKSYPEQYFSEIARNAHNKFNNINIMIERNFGYNCQGRNQTEEEAFAIQEEIKNYFKLINLNFLTVKSNNALKDILKFLEKK
ncbi:MAG: AAA family ATPase [Clostridia bacterium]|nr:AAA family ATPase [Clostridia bacterium]